MLDRTRLLSALLFLPIVACVVASPATALADDVADEADLQFQIGAGRYRDGDYQGALEHFLASNRLVPNRNVSFNIGRSYEQLKQYPAAFRYYSQALENEKDKETRGRVEAALEKIKPNVAVLRIVTDPPGATIYIDRRDLGPRGESPRSLGLAPGKYRVRVELPNYEPAESVEIEAPLAGETLVSLKLEPKLEGSSGNLVVGADERGALIEVDGRPRAFTPAIVSLGAGPHKIKISLRGFRAVEQAVEIRPNQETKLDLVLTQAEEVNAASRATETVEEAPSSVSIVRAEELRGMSYPTVAEALRGVRGVYVSDDRSYATVGFRGLARLGDYGNRVLVLLDGQPTNDNWIGSSYVGADARTDMEDIERIEVVRGPGSVLYGTNAFSGVINLVTRGVEAKTSGEVGVGVSEYGAGRGRARVNLRLGDDAKFWMSVAAARSAGRDFYFPEFASAPGGGNVRDLDGFKSATVNGRLTFKSFTAMWLVNSRNKFVPSAEFDTIVGDARLQQVDTRGMVELRFEPKISERVQWLSRVHANLYGFRGQYPRTAQEGGLERDTFDGSWFGIEQRVVYAAGSNLRLTLGGEAQFHQLVHQTAGDENGGFLDDDRPYQVQAGYLLADVPLSSAVRVSAGTRVDHYSTFGSSNNPRLALILRPYEAGNLKLMAGKAFRAPSIYELFYNDGGSTQRASPDLSPESIYSGEIEFSHRFSPTVSGVVAGYGNLVRGLIVGRGGSTADPLLYYANSEAPVGTVGAEVELRREWRQGWMVGASYSTQHSRYLAGASVADFFGGDGNPRFRHVPNAPEHLVSVRGAVPILARALLASTRVSVEGPRFDRHDAIVDSSPQGQTDPAFLWDVVLSGEEQRWGLRYSLGVYNAFDSRYRSPVSNEFRQKTIVQNGRTFLATANVVF
ncbi:MAG TPA: TonB-dependent receptor [Polyangiaceae bacterium]|nr:TonB-dependent receptor [Polyangiaceae bacterium]